MYKSYMPLQNVFVCIHEILRSLLRTILLFHLSATTFKSSIGLLKSQAYHAIHNYFSNIFSEVSQLVNNSGECMYHGRLYISLLENPLQV